MDRTKIEQQEAHCGALLVRRALVVRERCLALSGFAFAGGAAGDCALEAALVLHACLTPKSRKSFVRLQGRLLDAAAELREVQSRNPAESRGILKTVMNQQRGRFS